MECNERERDEYICNKRRTSPHSLFHYPLITSRIYFEDKNNTVSIFIPALGLYDAINIFKHTQTSSYKFHQQM